MSDKPKIGIPEDAAHVQFGDLLQELPRRVADVLLAAHDPLLAEMGRPRVIREWRTALKQAAESGELKGSMLRSAGALSGWMMSEEVTADSIRSFLEARGFEVVAPRPDVPGEMQSRVIGGPRRHDLSAVVDLAKVRAADPTDTASVWPELLRLAGEKRPPLMEVVEGSIKYTKSSGVISFYTKDALRKKLRRDEKAAANGRQRPLTAVLFTPGH
jgi:hypothetical protein